MPRANEGIIGDRVIRNFGFLYKLAYCRNPHERFDMIQRARRDQLLAVIDICANVVHKDFKLTSQENKRVEKYWDLMVKLSRVRTPQGAIRVIQKGEGVNQRGSRPLKSYKSIVKDQHVYRKQRGYGFIAAIAVPVLSELALSGANFLIRKAKEKFID